MLSILRVVHSRSGLLLIEDEDFILTISVPESL